MPVPPEYSRASDQFYEYLVDARDTAELGSTHQAYTMTQGVFQTFRRRLDIKDAIRFASALPVGLRALFVTDWDPDEPKHLFEDRASMTREVQSLRAEHNWAPDNAISIVATVLRRHVDEATFAQVLLKLPDAAVEFWEV